jgi:serine/threonine protein kinase
MEYCAGGTLYDYIHSEELNSEILPPQVVAWARQIGSGMQYLHSKKIIHRDLKSLK